MARRIYSDSWWPIPKIFVVNSYTDRELMTEQTSVKESKKDPL